MSADFCKTMAPYFNQAFGDLFVYTRGDCRTMHEMSITVSILETVRGSDGQKRRGEAEEY